MSFYKLLQAHCIAQRSSAELGCSLSRSLVLGGELVEIACLPCTAHIAKHGKQACKRMPLKERAI